MKINGKVSLVLLVLKPRKVLLYNLPVTTTCKPPLAPSEKDEEESSEFTGEI